MRIRRTGLATVGAAFALVFLVAVIAAQAAPQQKKFTATVHVSGGEVTTSSATLTLTLTNITRSQTLGSANFIVPPGVTLNPTPLPDADRDGWNAAVAGNTVTFRSTSNALGNGDHVSADVSVTINQTTCANAGAWTVQAKQSNDFSGAGNDFQFSAQGSDLVALGSFDIADIETVTQDGQHVPAILTIVAEDFVPEESTTTAYDICGEVKKNYSGATRTATLLTGADYAPDLGLDWEDGVGTVDITPVVTETDNRLHLADGTSGVSADSNFFDTTDRLCTSQDLEPCEWPDPSGKLKVKSDPPPEDASLGIGFNSDLSYDCNGDTTPVADTLVNINPRYELTEVEAIAVTMTYAKSATPGPASNYDVCFRKDEDTTWTSLEQCPSSSPTAAQAPCFISRKNVSGGDLEIVLWVATDDPWGGIS